MSILLECKVCGKKYEGCNTINRTGAFRWRDVACSPEHGSIYLSRIMKSRNHNNESVCQEREEVEHTDASTDPVISEDLLDDGWFDEYNDDDEEYEDDYNFGNE